MNNIKIDKKSHKNILVYYIEYVAIKDLNSVKIYKFIDLIFNKMNGYFEEINENKHLTLLSINEVKEKIKKYEELLVKSEI